MAYYPNSSAGGNLDAQCAQCKYGEKPCPIALAQMMCNYDACNNKVATEVLNYIVTDETGCQLFVLDPKGLSREPRTFNAKRLHALQQIAKTDGVAAKIAQAVLA